MIEGEGEADDDGIWEEHVAALEGFLAICTQWRYLARADGAVLRTGLDYTAARACFDLRGIAMTPDLWMDIQIIEIAAIAASNDEARA